MKYYVAGYLRLSRENMSSGEEESGSISSQRLIIEKFIEKHPEMTLVKEYVDDGFTGSNFDRPGFLKMLHDLEKGLVNTVIVKDLSRLGRDYVEVGNYIYRYFPEHGVRFLTADGSYDSLDDKRNNYTCNEMVTFKSLINDMYSMDCSKKVRAAYKRQQERGLFTGTYAPFGYQKDEQDKHKLIKRDDTAQVVQWIFEQYLNGKSEKWIGRYLEANHIPAPGFYHNRCNSNNKYRWHTKTISEILDNQVYIGNMVQRKTRKLNYKSKKTIVIEPESQVIVRNTHEPIIDIEQFNMVQKLRNKWK